MTEDKHPQQGAAPVSALPPGQPPADAVPPGHVATQPEGAIGGAPTGAYPPDSPAAGPAPALPAAFGRYELRELLGRGGMGAVYLASDSQLHRLVALKLPRLRGEDHPEARERFLREARAPAGLHHPNICPVYDAGEIDGALYLSMAYIEGEPLSRRIQRQGPLPVGEAAALAATAARAMQEAHDRGIVHRDLKPANVMVDRRGQPVVMDFGLAQRTAQAGEARLTQSGAVVGTPAYMAPEQAQGGDGGTVGPACDVYSLGVVLYEMLAGRLPFRAEGVGQLLAQVQRDPPPRPSEFRPDLPPGLEAVCLRALAKKPAERFASMTDFAAALAPFTERAPAPAACNLLQTVDYVPPRRRRWWLAAAGLLLAVLAGVLWYVLSRPGPANVPTHDEKTPAAAEADAEAEARGQRIARLLREGIQAFNRNQHEQAEAVAEHVLQLDAQSPGGLALRGTARGARGKPEEGLADCEAALKLNPETALAYGTRGTLLGRQGKRDEAIADLTAAIRLAPDNTKLYVSRSYSYLQKGEYEQAAADAGEALSRNPRLPAALENRAAAYLNLGRYDDALKDLDAALELDPASAQFHWIRSLAHARKGDPIKAREDREAAEAIDPSFKGKKPPAVRPLVVSPRPEMNEADRAALERLLGRMERALTGGDNKAVLDSADEALRLDPGHRRALELRTTALYRMGRWEDAWEQATRTVRFYPSSSEGYEALCALCIQRQQWARGIAYATIALRIKPDDSSAWSDRGYCYLRLGNYHQALADGNECLKHGGRQAASFANRAAAYAALADDSKALADLDAAIARDPTNVKYHLQRSIIHTRLGNLSQAGADRERAAELSPLGSTLPSVVVPDPLPPPHRDPELKLPPPEGG
jgi:tetratricopeptide (TPR) repeat protein